MAAMKEIEERVKSLESKFNLAVTVALFLGISVAGLGTWVKLEAQKVNDLHTQIRELQPFVQSAQEAIKKTSDEQLVVIRSRAEPIVTQLTQQTFSRMASNSTETSEGVTAQNGFGGKDLKSSVASCPAGQYLAGLTAHWGGTCQGKCDEDGGTLHSLQPICRKIVP